MPATELLVPVRFNGPPESANGGFMAGRVASLFRYGDTVQVTLRRPPPLEVAMTVRESDGRVDVLMDGAVVAEAVRVDDAAEPVDAIDPDDAAAAMTRFAGLSTHPFPTCFVCGTERADGDGLGLWAGPILAGDADGIGRLVATVFQPRSDIVQSVIGTGTAEIIGPEIIWAALDCTGGWATLLPGRPAVLGRMTAIVDAMPSVGERCVVVGQLDRIDGRKSFTRSTAYGADGRELGRAGATWIELPAS